MNAVSSITGMDVQNTLEHSSAPTGGGQGVATRFADLLAQQPPSHTIPEVGAPTAISNLIGEHEHMYRGLMKDLSHASETASTMTPQELTVKQVELMFRVTNVSMQHSGMTYVAQSTKNGIQTLMKNQ